MSSTKVILHSCVPALTMHKYILIHHANTAFHLHLKMSSVKSNSSPQPVQFTHGWQVQFLAQGLTFIPNKLGGG